MSEQVDHRRFARKRVLVPGGDPKASKVPPAQRRMLAKAATQRALDRDKLYREANKSLIAFKRSLKRGLRKALDIDVAAVDVARLASRALDREARGGNDVG